MCKDMEILCALGKLLYLSVLPHMASLSFILKASRAHSKLLETEFEDWEIFCLGGDLTREIIAWTCPLWGPIHDLNQSGLEGRHSFIRLKGVRMALTLKRWKGTRCWWPIAKYMLEWKFQKGLISLRESCWRTRLSVLQCPNTLCVNDTFVNARSWRRARV